MSSTCKICEGPIAKGWEKNAAGFGAREGAKTVYHIGCVAWKKKQDARKEARANRKEVKKVLTLSKYHWGVHSLDEKSKGEYSFKESLVPLGNMIEELGAKGVKLGTKIEVIMRVKK